MSDLIQKRKEILDKHFWAFLNSRGVEPHDLSERASEHLQAAMQEYADLCRETNVQE